MAKQRKYPSPPKKIYFFGTCLVDVFFPEAGIAGMELIQRAGIDVIYPNNQTCCGQPAWNAGFREQARSVARAQIDCFSEDYPIVVPSGSCAGMMRFHYPRLFRGESEEARVNLLSNRVFELTEFLVRILDIKLEDLGEPIKVALHISCSARREIGAASEHRALLQQLNNVELVEPDQAEECCGFGGTFAIKHPEISGVLVADKATALLKSGARRVLSGDCGCLLNIGGHLAHRESDVQHQHIASFLWERSGEFPRR